jgi:hypothetical protein
MTERQHEIGKALGDEREEPEVPSRGRGASAPAAALACLSVKVD